MRLEATDKVHTIRLTHEQTLLISRMLDRSVALGEGVLATQISPEDWADTRMLAILFGELPEINDADHMVHGFCL